MDLIECPYCRTRVVASSNGECPACRKPLDTLADVIDVERQILPKRSGSVTLVTVARFIDLVEASLAKNCLEDAGIKAFLAEAETATMAWEQANARGGVKVQVAEPDANRARVVLDEQHAASPAEDQELVKEALAARTEASETDEEAPPEDDGLDEPEPEPTTREKDAERAFRGAVLGLLFFPLQFYVTYLLLLVVFSNETLAGRARGRVMIAAAINIIYMAILYIVWRNLSGPH